MDLPKLDDDEQGNDKLVYKDNVKKERVLTFKKDSKIVSKKQCFHERMCDADITIKEERAVYLCQSVKIIASAISMIALSANL